MPLSFFARISNTSSDEMARRSGSDAALPESSVSSEIVPSAKSASV